MQKDILLSAIQKTSQNNRKGNLKNAQRAFYTKTCAHRSNISLANRGDIHHMSRVKKNTCLAISVERDLIQVSGPSVVALSRKVLINFPKYVAFLGTFPKGTFHFQLFFIGGLFLYFLYHSYPTGAES